MHRNYVDYHDLSDNTEELLRKLKAIDILVQIHCEHGDLEFDSGNHLSVVVTLHDATIKYGANKGIVKEDLYDLIVQKPRQNA